MNNHWIRVKSTCILRKLHVKAVSWKRNPRNGNWILQLRLDQFDRWKSAREKSKISFLSNSVSNEIQPNDARSKNWNFRKLRLFWSEGPPRWFTRLGILSATLIMYELKQYLKTVQHEAYQK